MPRVLTIEDDAVTGQEIVAELTSHGLEVEWADNGREGLAKAVARWLRPDHPGPHAARGRWPDHRHHPAQPQDRHADPDDQRPLRRRRARYAACGPAGDDYLTKPFASDEMAARVEVLLRRNSVPMTQTRTAGRRPATGPDQPRGAPR